MFNLSPIDIVLLVIILLSYGFLLGASVERLRQKSKYKEDKILKDTLEKDVKTYRGYVRNFTRPSDIPNKLKRKGIK